MTIRSGAAIITDNWGKVGAEDQHPRNLKIE